MATQPSRRAVAATALMPQLPPSKQGYRIGHFIANVVATVVIIGHNSSLWPLVTFERSSVVPFY